MVAARKTQAMRLLDAKRVPYTATVYDEADEFHTAEEAAKILGVPLSAMYKTLVVFCETRPQRRDR